MKNLFFSSHEKQIKSPTKSGRKSILIILFASVLLHGISINADAATYYSRTNAAWNVATTWSTIGYGGTAASAFPIAGDIVNIGNSNTVTVVANAACASITIDATGTLNPSGAFTVSAATGITVNGTYTNQSTGAITTPLWNCNGTYNHNSTVASLPAGSATTTWGAVSNLNINGFTGTTAVNLLNFMNRTFGNVTFNCAGITTGSVSLITENGITIVQGNFTITSMGTGGTLFMRKSGLQFAGELDINGNFTLTSGIFDLHNGGPTVTNSTVKLNGNFTMTGGNITQTTTSAGSTVFFIFNKAGTQTFTKSGGTITSGTTVGPGIQFSVIAGSTLNMGTSVLDGTNQTSFNLNAGGGIITANTAGISTTTATGSIQVAGTKTYSTSANYTYNSLVATQVTGNGVTGANNLTFNNTFSTGVTFSNSIATTGTMAIATGAHVSLGTFTSSAAALILGGTTQTSGTSYGGTSSSAVNKIPLYFNDVTGILNVSLPAPSNLSYTSPNSFSLNVPVTDIAPMVSGVVTTYAISPSLPAGLSFSTTTGTISGTPTANSPSATYTVTATNSSGSTTFGVVISVGNYRYAVNATSASWNDVNTWASTSGGTPGASVPVSGDIVFIGEAATARTVTIPTGFTAACGSITMGNRAAATVAILSFTDATSILNIDGDFMMNRPSSAATSVVTVGTGSLTVGGTLELSHFIGLNATTTATNQVTISTGTVSVGNLLYNAAATGQAQIVFSGAGTLNIGGSFTVTGGFGTLTPSTGTVNFNGTTVAQTIPIGAGTVTYNNLTINNTNAGGATLSAAISGTNVTGNVSVGNVSSASNFNNGGFAVVLASNKSFSLANGSTFNLSGTSAMVTVSGTGTRTFGTTSTTNYRSSSAQTIAAANYGNLTNSGGGARTFASSGTVGIAGTFSPGGGTYTITGSTVDFNGTSPQTINGITYNNLTISGSGNNSKTAGNNIIVNGILNLISANTSATQGALDMSTYTLDMGAATTTGTGDVTGIVRRTTSFAFATDYTFGNAFTKMNFSAGILPTSISFKISLTATHTWKNDAIHRYYDITRVGGSSATHVTLNLHYLDSELNSVLENNTLDFFDYDVSKATNDDHGQTSFNATDNWVSLSNLDLVYVANSSYDLRYWTIGTHNTGSTCEWISGGANLTDWNNSANWNGGIPTSASDVIIPAITVSATADNPTLPASTTINTINIQSGGVLNDGSGSSLTIAGSTNAWQNTGSFNAGSGIVLFTNAAATLSGTTNFNNVTISSGSLTPAASSIIRIAGVFSNSGTLQARTNLNTIEYNGAAQTVINPNGTTAGYSSLILSGSGVKTMPITALSIGGDFSMSGTASATAGAEITTNGNFTIGSGTSFTTGALEHKIGGNFLNSGTFSSSGTINFNGSSSQIVGGSVSSTFNHLTINNSAGVTLNSGNPTVNGDLTFTNGKISTGSNTLILGNTAGVIGAGAGKYVFGNLQKGIAASGTYIFEIGNAANYLPTTIVISSVTAAGNLTCNTTNGQQPNFSTSGLSQTKYLNRYWTVTNSGITFGTYDVTFTFDAGDIVNSAAYGSLLVKKYSGGWTDLTTGSNTSTTVTTTANTTFSDFVAGETSSSGTDFYRSVSAGNWSTLATWESSSTLGGTYNAAAILPTNAAQRITIQSGHTITIDATATASDLYIIGTLSSGSGINLSVDGIWDNTGGTFIAGTGTVTFDGTTTISGSSVNSFNNVTISGTLIAPSAGTINVAGNWSNSGTFTHNSGTVNFNGAITQTITGSSTFNNLTITKGSAGQGVTASANQTINGVLNLDSPNHSGTQGCLSMTDPNTLFMGATATIVGTGDVSGYINRSTFALSTPYTFGNQYTLINFTTGPLPTSVTLEVYLANPTWKPNAINRYYDVTQTGGTPDTRLRFNAHYLDSELNGVTEANMDLFDHHKSGPYSGTTHDHGRTDNDVTNNWVGFSNVGLVFLGTATADDHFWTLGNRTAGDNCTWIGGSPSGVTDWNLPGNWEGGVPLTTSNVIIPSATYNPVLPDGKTINSLNIQSGGILNATTGTTTLTIGGATGWTNNGTFNAGMGNTIVFNSVTATINGETNFNNVTIANGASLTPGTNNIMVIGDALTLSGSGVLNAATNSNIIEYNKSGDQTVIVPIVGYSNLILSGSGIKIMPGSALSILGNFSLSGTTSATAEAAIYTTGNFTIGSGTAFTAGAYTHNVAGNWTNNGGTFTSTGSTINFNGTGIQTIDGSTLTAFNDVAVASGSRLNLSSLSHTAHTLRLNSIGTAAGTWGVTASTATHKDDTYFAGTAGTLNVGTVSCADYDAAISGTTAICTGFSTNLIVTITGGTSPYTVVYTDGTSPVTINGYTSGSNISVSPASGTTYTLTMVTDAYGCTGTVSGSAVITISAPSFVPVVRYVSDLAATGENIKWYAASTGGAALLSTDVLPTGTTHYYASQTVNGVESTTRFDVTATVDPTPCAPTGDAAQPYSAGATVANLLATGSNIRWYVASTGGTALDPASALENGKTYFASQTINCTESATRLEVTVNITL